MGVEIAGPQGYDYQYLVSVLLILENINRSDIEAFVDKANEEDLQIRFIDNDEAFCIEVQVKSQDITLSSFCTWISHFEARSFDINLMSKLRDNVNDYVLFVSKGRASDSVSRFVSPSSLHRTLASGFTSGFLREFKQSVLQSNGGSSELDRKRRTYLEEFFRTTKAADLKRILRKSRVRENYSEEVVVQKIKHQLQSFNIPYGQQDTAIQDLLKEIRDSRGSGVSVIAELNKALERHKVGFVLVRDEHHIERLLREQAKQRLEDENVLLLAGVSYSGKSYLAKDIAQTYQTLGYQVKIANDLHGDDGALSFLAPIEIDDRLLVLEDPLGSVVTKEQSSDILKKVRELVQSTTSNRRIIVTTRTDILLEAMGKKTLANCQIGKYDWLDCGMENTDEVKRLWVSYYGNSLESLDLLQNIVKWLSEREQGSLELGHITNIVNILGEDLTLLARNSIAGIIESSRIDSYELADSVVKRGPVSKRLFMILGMCCNTVRPVALHDLAFAVSELNEYPSIKSRNVCLSYSFGTPEIAAFPNYSQECKLSDVYRSELSFFANRGFVKFDHMKRLVFGHPIYHYASYLILQREHSDIIQSESVINDIERSLGVLAVESNLCSLAMLEDVYLVSDANREIRSLILRSINSIFPVVKDRVIMFLDTRIKDLGEEEQKLFFNVIEWDNDVEHGGILWDHGNPWFNPLSERDIFDCYSSRAISEATFTSVLSPSPEVVWEFMQGNRDRMLCLETLERISKYGESFIRKKAMHQIFSCHAYTMDTIDKYLKRNEHPDVVYNIFHGAIQSWSRYDLRKQRQILDFFKKEMNRVSVILKSRAFLENFEDEYKDDSLEWSAIEEKDKPALWSAWHEVFIAYLEKFDAKFVRLNEVHMGNVTNHSLQYLNSPEQIVALSNAWIDWLVQYAKTNDPDDYGMGVGDYLFAGTKYESSDRGATIDRMLSAQDTSLITSFMKSIVDYWLYLSSEEKALVFQFVLTSRSDLKWIKAICLTRHASPVELQIIILGDEISGKSAKLSVDLLVANDMLEVCLSVFTGYPQPLWRNGYHHSDIFVWDRILVEVTRREEIDNSFRLSLRELSDILYNNNVNRMPEIYSIYEDILLKTKEKRDAAFSQLLYDTITQNQCNKRAWELVLLSADNIQREDFYVKIAESIELIQYRNTNLLDLFDRETLIKGILPHMPVESSIYSFCVMCHYLAKEGAISDIGDTKSGLATDAEELDAFRTRFKQSITRLYETSTVRAFFINSVVRSTSMEIGVDFSEFEDIFEVNANRVYELVGKKSKKYDDTYALSNWRS